MKKLNETIGSVEYDGLICGPAPAAGVTDVAVAPSSGGTDSLGTTELRMAMEPDRKKEAPAMASVISVAGKSHSINTAKQSEPASAANMAVFFLPR